MGAITLGLQGVASVGSAGLSVRILDKQGYKRYLRREQRDFRRRMTKQLRLAAKEAKNSVNRSARSAVGRKTGRLHRGASFRVNARGFRFVRGNFSTRSLRTRSGGATITALIFMRLSAKNRSALYAPGIEEGGTVNRRQSKPIRGRAGASFTRKAHTARFKATPFFERGIRRSEASVYRILGRSFRVV